MTTTQGQEEEEEEEEAATTRHHLHSHWQTNQRTKLQTRPWENPCQLKQHRRQQHLRHRRRPLPKQHRRQQHLRHRRRPLPKQLRHQQHLWHRRLGSSRHLRGRRHLRRQRYASRQPNPHLRGRTRLRYQLIEEQDGDGDREHSQGRLSKQLEELSEELSVVSPRRTLDTQITLATSETGNPRSRKRPD